MILVFQRATSGSSTYKQEEHEHPRTEITWHKQGFNLAASDWSKSNNQRKAKEIFNNYYIMKATLKIDTLHDRASEVAEMIAHKKNQHM